MTTQITQGERRTVLTVDRVSKHFPGLRALDQVSLQVRAGEIVALLGQNGSGKSTLVKILAGVYTADSGTISLHGDDADRRSVLHFIHQDLGLVESLSTVENLALGRADRALFPLRRRGEAARARQLIARFDLDFDVDCPVAKLTPAQRSSVAIARAMDGWSASADNILVLDEPTAALHGDEVGILFTAVRRVADEGAGVIFISHRLEEVTHLASRMLVLRDGKLVADTPTAGLTTDRIAELITGRQTAAASAASARERPTTPAALVVRSLRGATVREFEVDVWPQEIVGVTGSLGSGREHVSGLIYGAVPRTSGTVSAQGVQLRRGRPHESLQHRVAFIPSDRRAHGAAMTLSVRENLTLPDLRPICLGRLHLRRRRERADVLDWSARVNLQPVMTERPLGLFSGGNQQKAVIARWLRTHPAVLLVDEPTQGVDVGSSEAIRALIVEAARQGMAVLVTSSDNSDLVRMCSRVIVMRDGVGVAELTGPEIDDHRLTQECLGVREQDSLTEADLETSHV